MPFRPAEAASVLDSEPGWQIFSFEGLIDDRGNRFCVGGHSLHIYGGIGFPARPEGALMPRVSGPTTLEKGFGVIDPGGRIK